MRCSIARIAWAVALRGEGQQDRAFPIPNDGGITSSRSPSEVSHHGATLVAALSGAMIGMVTSEDD